MNATQTLPRLPRILSHPMGLLPPIAYRSGLGRMLNKLFAIPLAQGELDFLEQRRVGIHIADAPVAFTLTVAHRRLVVQAGKQATDLCIEGNVYAFMLLASRREDADTLFFQRQLKIQGDTELGLQVKNFLDGLDLSTVPLHGLIEFTLRQGLRVADRIERLRWRSTTTAGSGELRG